MSVWGECSLYTEDITDVAAQMLGGIRNITLLYNNGVLETVVGSACPFRALEIAGRKRSEWEWEAPWES